MYADSRRTYKPEDTRLHGDRHVEIYLSRITRKRGIPLIDSVKAYAKLGIG